MRQISYLRSCAILLANYDFVCIIFFEFRARERVITCPLIQYMLELSMAFILNKKTQFGHNFFYLSIDWFSLYSNFFPLSASVFLYF